MKVYPERLPSFLLFFALFLQACQSGPRIPVESPTSGTIHISVDESFKPVIDSQLKVFESSFPNARILVDYKPEAACIRDLYNDSTRLVIITRGLTLPEERYFNDTARTPAISGILAYDAIAMVVSKSSSDTLMTMDQVKALLKGDSKREAVMDGTTATSTVRYLMDSVLRGQPLGKNVVAAHSSPEVISYVAGNKEAVGFVGVSWIGDREDSTALAFLNKVNVVAVACDACPGKPFVYPYQANIALMRYPMVRGLYYILKENFSGVGNNFINFLQYERGQLIFKRSYLVPGRMSFELRNMEIQQ